MPLNTKENHLKDLLHLHFIVIIFGFTGVLGRLISLPAAEMVWFRMVLASMGLFVWLGLTHKIKVPKRIYLLKYLGTGFVVAIHWVAFFGSIKASTVSVTLACLASTTLFASLLEPFFNRSRVHLADLTSGVVVIIALFIIFKFETQYTQGIILGLVSAFFGALFMVLNKGFLRYDNALSISSWEMLGGSIGLTFFLLLYSFDNTVNLNPTPTDLFWLALLAFVCTSYAFMASIKVMRSLSAFQVVLTINLEPVYGIILAYIVFVEAELMTLQFYIGTFILIATVFSYSWLKRKQNKI